jgi:hypothetical protein
MKISDWRPKGNKIKDAEEIESKENIDCFTAGLLPRGLEFQSGFQLE